ncbi:conserved hypothetical protein [Bradyrhizobium sp. ORS 375]|nr:conserved hypothetical protein [Bradyrhizobium sp. ORS 375]
MAPIQAWSQAPSAPAAAPAPSAGTTVKKPAAKAKQARKPVPAAAAESGPCRLGVVSMLGDEMTVHKFGLTVFETEDQQVTIPGWGLDDLVMARVRAASGNDPGIRRISVPKETFDRLYHQKRSFLPDPNQSLTAIVRDVTSNANCARYLAVIKFEGKIPGSNLVVNGIGAYNQGIGSVLRHSHLFANLIITLIDGQSYERVGTFSADVGSRLNESMRLTEDPINKLDNADFPEPLAAAANSAVLRERLRALISTKMDRYLPSYLQVE